MGDVIVVKSFVTPDERCQLELHARRLFEQDVLAPNRVGPHRFSKSICGTPYLTPTIEAIGTRIVTLLGGGEIERDPMLGWIISYIEPQGFVHPHRDDDIHYRQSDRRHLRCNVVISNNRDSGHPLINRVKYEVDETDMWMFYASELFHGSEVVHGPKPRIVYQFGFSVQHVAGLNSRPKVEKIIESLRQKVSQLRVAS